MAEKIRPLNKFQPLVKSLIGLPVALPWKGAGTTIFLELGKLGRLYSKHGHGRKGKACIAVFWDWRVECSSRVLYGSSNSGPEIERGIGSLRGSTIQQLSIEGQVPELVVHFSNEQCLRSMVMLTGDPVWTVRLPGKTWIYARAGALLTGKGAVKISEHGKAVFALAEQTAARWGTPSAGPQLGRCSLCQWFIQIDGDGYLLDYGVCIGQPV